MIDITNIYLTVIARRVACRSPLWTRFLVGSHEYSTMNEKATVVRYTESNTTTYAGREAEREREIEGYWLLAAYPLLRIMISLNSQSH